MRAFILAALVPFALGQQYMLNLDCTEYPGPCNNDCYAVFVANKQQILNYPGSGASDLNRRKAGCSRNPCNKNKMAKANSDENSCDEYPFASVTEGGSEAILRCTEGVENTAEGNALNGFLNSRCKYKPCSFMVTFGNPNSGETPFCQDGGGANDGFEYQFIGGKFQLAGRDTNATQDDEWVLHESDPADYFPPHLRREFLLEDGSRTVLPTRNLTASFDGTVFYTFRNDTVYELRAVRELFGMEKSPGLRDPTLQDPQ